MSTRATDFTSGHNPLHLIQKSSFQIDYIGNQTRDLLIQRPQPTVKLLGHRDRQLLLFMCYHYTPLHSNHTLPINFYDVSVNLNYICLLNRQKEKKTNEIKSNCFSKSLEHIKLIIKIALCAYNLKYYAIQKKLILMIYFRSLTENTDYFFLV